MSRKSVSPQHFILTANDLLSGDIVYWTTQNGWTRRFAESTIVSTPKEQERISKIGREQESANVVVGAYMIGVLPTTNNQFQPAELREIRRIQGPSILGDAQLQQAA